MLNIQVIGSSSKGNCYRISDGVTPVLLEVGLPIRRIKEGLKFRLHEIEGCLITHEHGDHCKAAEDIINMSIPCYMSKGTCINSSIVDYLKYAVHIISSRCGFTVGTWVIKPFDVEHDAAEPLGFLLYSKHTKEKLLYLTDTYYTQYTFPGLNYIMVECNHSYKILDENVAAGRLEAWRKKRLIQSHMALENVKDMLQANDLSQVKEIYLIHLSDMNSDAELFKKEIQKLTGKPVYIAGE